MATVQGMGHLNMCQVTGYNHMIPVFSLHKNVNLLREQSCSLVLKYIKTKMVCWRSTGRVICGSLDESTGVKELKEERKPLRILIAGGGIGGLVLALALKNKGGCFDVKVFEKDLSAVKGEGMGRGPIQIQSDALAALQAIDCGVAEEIMESGCVTGNRVTGLVDGLSGSWYIKFDTFTPAVERGLPVTRVISRMTLQKILVHAIGPEIIENSSNVVDFNDDGQKVTVMLEDGRQYEGDLLVGADGIWSKVRAKLFGPKGAIYSQYTCYSGIVNFVPADINTVAYRVFLGYKQYYVSCDVGSGKMQWFAFHYEPAGSVDPPNGKKERLLNLFGAWCEEVVDLLLATPEKMILRRDIYDRKPILTWSKGNVTLLGDSAHAMQPNMGQGGCMAIEDSYQLSLELQKAYKASFDTGKSVDIASALKRYEKQRRLRTGVIHGMARMAAIMASMYRPYLHVGLGPLSLQIPHPGTSAGRRFLQIVMPMMLSWVLGGNSSKLEGWIPSCRLSDKANEKLKQWLADDHAMEHAIDTEIACGSEGVPALLPYPQVSERHASIVHKDNAFFLTDMGSQHGTWIIDQECRRHQVPSDISVKIHPNCHSIWNTQADDIHGSPMDICKRYFQLARSPLYFQLAFSS